MRRGEVSPYVVTNEPCVYHRHNIGIIWVTPTEHSRRLQFPLQPSYSVDRLFSDIPPRLSKTELLRLMREITPCEATVASRSDYLQ